MTYEVDSFTDGYDRPFLDYSSKLAEPFCWTYGMLWYRFVSPLDPNKFDNTTSKVKEIATRILIFSSATLAFAFAGTHLLLGAMVMGTAATVFRAIGFALQKNRFTHVSGKAPEVSLHNGQARVMTWKICGEFGGLHYREGGVIHWRSRIDQIVQKILAQDPDIIVLQQVNDTALAERLIARLGDRYAHFFTHIDGGTWKSVNGCMVISKCAVQTFSHTELGELFTIKAHPEDTEPCIRLIATELAPGKENKERRKEHVGQIITHLLKEKGILPTLLVGSNADQSDPEEAAFLSKYLYHSYRGKEPTSTDQLAIQWDPESKERGESYDFISLFKRNIPDGRTLPVIEKNIRLLGCEIVRGFNEAYDTKTALSHHHAVVTTFDGLKAAESPP